jgi:hypothetical protein
MNEIKERDENEEDILLDEIDTADDDEESEKNMLSQLN